MPIINAWIIRALAVRLREPGMKAQRRFMFVVSLVMALFVTGAVLYLFRQPTEDALESAAIKVFALMGVLIAFAVAAAVVLRRKTGAKWTDEEAIRMSGEGHKAEHPRGR